MLHRLTELSSKWMSTIIAAVAIVGPGCAFEAPDDMAEEARAPTIAGEGPGGDYGDLNETIGLATQALGAPGSVSDLQTVGGSGGSEFNITGGGVIYGIRMRTGQRVDQIRYAFYLPSQSDNLFRAGDFWDVKGPEGGNGGSSSGWLYCPSGYGAVGYYGRAGSRIDKLGLICANLSNVSQTHSLDDFGGNGGSSFSDQCGNGGLLVGLTGKAGSNIDRLTGKCATF